MYTRIIKESRVDVRYALYQWFCLEHLENVLVFLRERLAQSGHLPIYRYVYPLWNVFFKLFNFLDLSLFCCKFSGSIGLFMRSVVTGRTSTSEKGIEDQKQGWGKERATENSPLPPNMDPPEEFGKGRFSACLFYCSSVFLKLNFYGKFDHSLEKLKNQRS